MAGCGQSKLVAEQIIAFRRRFPHMGPRKIIARLAELHPHIEWPSLSTAGDILHRANLVQPRECRTSPAHPLRVHSEPVEANDLMTVHYKGQFLSRQSLLLLPTHRRRSREPPPVRLRGVSIVRRAAHALASARFVLRRIIRVRSQSRYPYRFSITPP
jgi:hypothetical protein